MSIRELERMMPPPQQARGWSERSWQNAEHVLGVTLPADYQDFLRSYGRGRISDFLEVFVVEPAEGLDDLVSDWRKLQPAFEHMQKGAAPLSYCVFPARPGLLPIAQSDNGDLICYLVDGDPDSWKIAVLISRDLDVKVFDLGLTEFLCAALGHELDVLPDDLEGVFTPK